MMNTYESSRSWYQYRHLLQPKLAFRYSGAPWETWQTVREREIEIDDCRPEGASWGALKLAQGGGNGPRVREARCEGWLGRPERQVLE